MPDDIALEQARREEREACAEIANAARKAASDWIRHADSYSGPESPDRRDYIVRRDVALGIEAAIRARRTATGEQADG